MGIPTNMTDTQLRMLIKIEKLLFEKKDYPFKKIIRLAKKKGYCNSPSRVSIIN